MSSAQHDFSVSDLEYNVITTLSNLLQSEEVLAKYADDADEAGDTEVATLFRSLRQQNQEQALRLRSALDRLIHEHGI